MKAELFAAAWFAFAIVSWFVIRRLEVSRQLVRLAGFGARGWGLWWAWTIAVVGAASQGGGLSLHTLVSKDFATAVGIRLLAALPIALWGAFVFVYVATVSRRPRPRR
ncbi:MAG TPA: hypothetical protein VEI06_14995 [Gemmatimonadaceae bacterium]|nr:hypothetical protein [Gemmatimonadaceae bacterium]